MASKRVTYPVKSNNPSDRAEVRKFRYQDANELREAIEDHASNIDVLLGALGISEGVKSVGEFADLSILQASYPSGANGSYAIINDGLGTTPHVATYNTSTNTWQTPTPDSPIIYLASVSARPTSGIANKIYLALDSGEIYYWHNAQYKVAGAQNTTSSIVYIANNNINWRTFKGEGNTGAGFEIGDQINHRIASTKKLLVGWILDPNLTLPTDATDTSKFERYDYKTALL